MPLRPDQTPAAEGSTDKSAMPRRRMRLLHELRLFFLALQFFTRLPIPRWVGFAPSWQPHAIRYFPATGLVVGIVSAMVYGIAYKVWPQAIAILLAGAAGLLITGAMHEDGMADTCDGMGAGGDPERILRMMRDSATGVFGMLGVVVTLALKYAALMALPWYQVGAAFVVAHIVSRLACLPLIRTLSYLRSEGKAKALAQQISGRESCIALVTALPLPILAGLCGWLPWSGMLSGIALAAASTWWLARLFVKRIGGYTGDCLGAVQQVAEVMLYLGLVAATRFS
jgi:adenosylcobinamide-GDP ribazoletransferase